MKKTGFAFLSLSLLCCNILLGQNKWEKCGYSIVRKNMTATNPDFEQRIDAQKKARLKMLANSRVTKTNINITVPVIFHIILNQQQMSQIGDSAGIAQRVSTQLQVLNEDYNRANADSVNIPAAFKPLYGNPAIKFGLAHTDPNGNSTNGWEIITTNLKGFDVWNSSGYKAKYTTTGGADAWNITSYLNIWIINMLQDTSQTGVIGLTVPPSYTDSANFTDPYPKNEMGVLIRYDAFGRKTNSSEFFYPGIDLGRTTTHEVGHYFGLFHPWGDDDDDGVCRCPGDPGGADDGIADTPPEGCRHYGCYTFPLYDNCTKNYPGLLYMNYMEYVDDSCMNMFTNDQVYVMDRDISLGYTHSLVSHPELLDYPGTQTPNFDYTFSIYPNPAVMGQTSLNFNQLPQGFESISIYNSIGQHVKDINTSNQQTTYYPVDMSGYTRGMYFIKAHFDNKTVVKKLIIL